MTKKEDDPYRGYGSECPFCKTTDIPAEATVCVGCGAKKSNAGFVMPPLLVFFMVAVLFALGVGVFVLWEQINQHFRFGMLGSTMTAVVMLPVGVVVVGLSARVLLYPFFMPRWVR